jgi:hypothetical protein
MTISLLRNFCFALLFISSACSALAGEERASIQILSGGRSFDSFEAYARFKDPSFAQAAVEQELSQPVIINDVAGVLPSLAEVVREFHGSGLAGRPLCPRDGLVKALQQATQGKEGPLLLVADGDKVRIMELKPQ